MPFQPGVITNPHGRTKRYWLTEKRRFQEAKKSFDKLCELRDGAVMERKQVFGDDGPAYIDVVPSAREYREVCSEILDRTIGKATPLEEKDEPGRVTIQILATSGNVIEDSVHANSIEIRVGGSNGTNGNGSDGA